MKAIVVHAASGRIKSVALVADDAGYEAKSGEQVIEIDSRAIDPKVDPSGLRGERLHEYAKKVVEDFRVAKGRIVRR
jgi:hypothetical protein